MISWLGKISFSLFLVHFPVLVLVGTLWSRFDWVSPTAGAAGLIFAYGLSLMVADLFHRSVERPGRLYRRKPRAGADRGALRPKTQDGLQAAVFDTR